MEQISEDDIHLLFGSLVMLPQDLAPSAKDTEPSVLSEKENTLEENTPKTPDEAKSSTTHKAATPQETPIVEEPKATYIVPKEPFLLITTVEQKEAYLAEDSPLRKILDAHKIPHLAIHLSTDISAIENPTKYECIWAIGLSLDLDKTLMQSGHTNALTSPNLLQLKTKEEKLAMYGPLKEFLSTNLERFSKL